MAQDLVDIQYRARGVEWREAIFLILNVQDSIYLATIALLNGTRLCGHTVQSAGRTEARSDIFLIDTFTMDERGELCRSSYRPSARRSIL